MKELGLPLKFLDVKVNCNGLISITEDSGF